MYAVLTVCALHAIFPLLYALSGSFKSTGDSATGAAVIPFLFVFFAGYCIAL